MTKTGILSPMSSVRPVTYVAGCSTLRPLDQDASPLARRTRLCPPGAASGARRDAATDRACRGAVRAAERGDPRTGAAMVAGASGAGDPGAARCVADRRRGDRGRGRLLQPV